MNKTREINAIVEKNLLNERVFKDDMAVQVYTRNRRLDAIVITYNCNICEVDRIEGQSSLFVHNKSTKHNQNLMDLRRQPRSRWRTITTARSPNRSPRNGRSRRQRSRSKSVTPKSHRSIYRSRSRNSRRTSPMSSSPTHRSWSIERHRRQRSQFKSFNRQRDRSKDCSSQWGSPKNSRNSHSDQSDSGQCFSHSQTRQPFDTKSQITEKHSGPSSSGASKSETIAEPKTKTSIVCWPQQSTLKVTNTNSAVKSMPINSIPSQLQTVPLLKSILKKSTASKENPFTEAKKILSSSNRDMHQFYDKIKLKSIAAASKRILDYLPNVDDNSKGAQYPDYINCDILLVTAQVRKMFAYKSINTLSMTNGHLEALMNDYMIELSSGSKIDADIYSNKESNAQVVSDDGACPCVVKSTDLRGIIDRMPPMGETIGTASSTNATKVNRMELLNDIAGSKCNDQLPTIAVVQSTSRDQRRQDLNEEANENENNCLVVESIEIENTTSGTEIETDDEVEYICTTRY